VLLVVNLEVLRAPLGCEPFSHIPRVYGVLAREPNAIYRPRP